MTESLIEQAARIAVVEVPRKILKGLRKKETTLDLRVEGELSEDQKGEIQALSEDFRYDFVLTHYKGTKQINCGFSKEEIQPNIRKTLQEYENLTVEIWQAQSLASIEEMKNAYW